MRDSTDPGSTTFSLTKRPKVPAFSVIVRDKWYKHFLVNVNIHDYVEVFVLIEEIDIYVNMHPYVYGQRAHPCPENRTRAVDYYWKVLLLTPALYS